MERAMPGIFKSLRGCARRLAVGLALLTFAAPVPAQESASVTPAPRTNVSASRPGGQVYDTTSREVASARDLMMLRADWRRGQDDLRADIASLRPGVFERLTPAAIGLLGVLVGGFFGVFQQRRQLKLSASLQDAQLAANERIGRATAGYASLSKVIEFQMRQVNEFYAPLLLMLQRSGGVRRQLLDQLVARDSERFIWRGEDDNNEHLYVVAGPDETPVPFRLIERMHELASDHAELMPLVKEIITIGTAMTELIHEKGGMAIVNEGRVNDALGRYLAHFSILRDVADKADKDHTVLETLRYNVSYPRELDGILRQDLTALTAEIDHWKELSRQMWRDGAGTVHGGLASSRTAG